jgi:AraC-like DNA-binding protein
MKPLRGSAAMSRHSACTSGTDGSAPSADPMALTTSMLVTSPHIPDPQRGWPEPRKFSERQLGQSWTLIEATLPKAMAWRDRELDLVDELRAHPERNRRLFRLLSVHRLRRLGLTFSQIAAELGITSRHARRLIAASVFLALRRELVRRDKAQARAEAIAARRARRKTMGEQTPLDRRRRAWPPRRRS